MKRFLPLPFLAICIFIGATQLSAQKRPERFAQPGTFRASTKSFVDARLEAWRATVLRGATAAHKSTGNGQRLSGFSDYDYSLSPGSQLADTAHLKYSGSRTSEFDYLNLYYRTAPKSEEPIPYPFGAGYTEYDSMWYFTPPGSGNADLFGVRTYTASGKISKDEYPESYYVDYVYNGAGQLIRNTIFMYNSGLMKWDSTYRDFYAYNSSGQMIFDSVERFPTNAWEPLANYYYSYNSSNQPIRLEIRQQVGSVWTTVVVSDVTYNPAFQKAVKIFGRNYDPTTMSLVNSSLDTLGYQGPNLFYINSSLWDDSANNWELYYEERRRLNAHSLPDSAWFRYWDNYTPTDTGRLMLSYNAQDNPILGIFYVGKHSSSDYETRWYYEAVPGTSVTNVASGKLPELSPNPTQNELRVRNYPAAEYQIYNTAGQLLKSGHSDASGIIPVNSLIPGIYYLKIADGNGQAGSASFRKE